MTWDEMFKDENKIVFVEHCNGPQQITDHNTDNLQLKYIYLSESESI